jgi:hypothetical protein
MQFEFMIVCVMTVILCASIILRQIHKRNDVYGAAVVFVSGFYFVV